MDPATNLQIIRPSRKEPAPGEVFVLQVPDESYRFGRVIRTDARWTRAVGAGPAILIYIYSFAGSSPELPPNQEMRTDRLLVPPILTNKLPWRRGYFATVRHVPLERTDILQNHCFWDASVTGKYFDEMSNELPGPVEPVGVYGLHSFRTIDDDISDALAITRVRQGH